MIDWNRVSELRYEVGEEEFNEVVELFLDEVREVLDRLSIARSADLAGEMHFLKGSALNVGLAEFGALCREYEGLSNSGRSEEIDFHRLKTVFGASLDSLKRVR